MNLRLHIPSKFILLSSIVSFFCIYGSPVFSQLTVEWDKTAGGLGWEEMNTLIATSDGGYLLGGITTSDGPYPGTEITHETRDTTVWPEKNGDFWFVKLDSLGNVLWDGRYGGFNQERIWSAQETSDGGFILGGESYSGVDVGTEHEQFNRGEKDFWLLKIDSQGNFIKDFTYGGPGEDVLRVVIPIEDGFMLFGYSDSDNNISSWGEKTDDSRGGEDFWIIRTDENLIKQEDWTIGGSGQERLNDAKMLPDGNFIISGWSTSDPLDPNPNGEVGEKTSPHYGLNDYWIVKIDPDANIIWQMTIGGEGEDVPNDIVVNPDGSIVITGFSCSEISNNPTEGNKTDSLYGNHDAYVVKIRDDGTQGVIEWQRTFGGAASDYMFSSIRTGTGNIMTAGYSFSQDTSSQVGNKEAPLIGESDFWVIYLDPDGNKIWDRTLGGLNADNCNKVIKAHDNGFLFGGNSSSMMYDPYKSENIRGSNDMWVVKINCFLDPPGLQNDTTSCDDSDYIVDATVDSCEYCTYLWSDGVTDPIRTFQPQEQIDLQLVVEHPDGCWVRDSITIDVIPPIETALSDFSPITCFGDNNAEFAIEEVIGGSPPFLFRLNDGEWEDFAMYMDMTPGAYTLEIIDTNNCTYDTAFYIEEPTEVLLELGEDIDLEYGDSVQLQALTNLLPGEYTVEWGQPSLLSCIDCLTPWVQPLSSTTFSVAILDSMGCKKEDNLSITIDRTSSIFIPNAFSPNNDNANDFFTIYADGSVEEILRLEIYSNWGEQLFTRYNFQPNQDQLGWDGRFDGRFMQPAVFTYVTEIAFIDGRVEVIYGDVTLVR